MNKDVGNQSVVCGLRSSSKKGEMTTEQIVMMIILIASFAVILFFLVRLGIDDEKDKEVCRNSVLTKGGIDKVSGAVGDSVPLNCQTSYVCLTRDGSCEAMHKPKTHKVKTEDEVYEALATELADCWWMFGEGKVNFAGEDWKQKLYCSLCSNVAFDDSVKEIFPSGEFSKNDFYKYLATNNISSDTTYYDYLFGTRGASQLLSQDLGNVNLNKQYFILLGATSSVSTIGWVATGGVVAAGLLLTPLTGGASLASAAGLLGVVGGGVIGGVAVNVIAPVIRTPSGDFIPPSLIEIGSKEYTDLECEEVATRS